MVSPLVKHKFVTAKADGPDSTFVKPTDWNDDHDLLVATKSVLGALVGGPAVELPLITTAAGDDGAMWSADKVAEMIASAIAAIPPPVLIPVGATIGWYSNTLPAGNWLFCNGTTLGNTGSGANSSGVAYQALFTYLWTNLSNTTAPMLTSSGAASTRGGSAAADWAALKRITLPDECGRVSAGADNMGGIASKDRLTVAGGGLDGDVLGLAGGLQTAKHKHAGTTNQNIPGGTFGVVAGGPATGDHTHTFETDEKTVTTVQPTIIKNVLIKY